MPIPLRLSLRALRAFALVVEHRSITIAARELNTAASAVATALDQVESEFGATLLIRTRSRGVAPTPEAIQMAHRFRALLDDYAAIMDSGHSIATDLAGTLRIGYYAPVAPAFLPRILGPMMTDNPDLRLEFQEHDNDSAQEALLAGRLDVILFAGQNLRSGIETRVLLDLPPYVLAPQNHPVTRIPALTLTEVARYPIIQLDLPLARPYLERLFRSQGTRPDIVATANNTEMVRGLVGAGIGISVLAMRPITDTTHGGDLLCTLPLHQDLPGLQLLSGCAPGRPRRLVSAFLTALHVWMDSNQARALTVSDV